MCGTVFQVIEDIYTIFLLNFESEDTLWGAICGVKVSETRRFNHFIAKIGSDTP